MKKILLSGILAFFGALSGFCGVIVDKPFQTAEDLKGVMELIPAQTKIVTLPEGGNAVEFTVPDDPEIKPVNKIIIRVGGEEIRGQRITVEGEAKVIGLTPAAKWGGGEFSMWTPYLTKEKKGQIETCHYCNIGSRPGGWRKLHKEIDIPLDNKFMLVSLGINNARGTILFRNVKVSTGDTLLNFPEAADMGYQDEKAGDRKGGWHDGGPDYDARKFPFQNKIFGNVPFAVLDPSKNNGKSVLVFRSAKLPDGITEASANVNAAAKYLYLLHAKAWEQKDGTRIGTAELENAAGKTFRFDVIAGEDAMEWFGARPGKNAWTAAQFPSGGSLGAVYVSRFELPEEIGVIKKVTLKHDPAATAMWMVLGVNLSGNLYRAPETDNFVIKENDIWKPIPKEIVPAPKAGSALDIGALFSTSPAGTFGRVIINPDGHFAFASAPDKAVRFMAFGTGREFGTYFGVPPECDSRERITEFVTQMRRCGYNMIRLWIYPIRTQAQKAFQYDPVKTDLMDWYIAELKRNGIYVVLSMSAWNAGYDYCSYWSDDQRRKNYSMYRNSDDRDAWLKWTSDFLVRTNPYTKTQLLTDPVVAGIDCNNELEFEFLRADDRYAPLWRAFLEEKYKTIGDLKKAWGAAADSLASFDDIRTFQPLGTDPRGRRQHDRADFVTSQERGLLDWEKAQLHKLGFKGFVTSFCMGRAMRQVGVRRSADFVMLNGYHALPIGTKGWDMVRGGRNPQDSSIASGINVIRTFLAGRMYDKPFDISEYGFVFWNRYRYEQGLVMGAYSALNDFDALSGFFMQVTTHPNYRITPFEMRHDPISRASELLTNLLFRRADVKTSKCVFRIKLDPEQAVENGEETQSVSAAQLFLGLLGQTYVDLTDLPLKADQVLFSRIGGSEIAVRENDSNIVDSAKVGFDFDKVVADLKKQGVIPRSNISSQSEGIYQSATGEIITDVRTNHMKVVTARTQGICAEAGFSDRLPNLDVISMNRRGCIALSSIDGENNIQTAKRLLLIVSTNVLNSNMSFADTEMIERIDSGTTPLLLETGRFGLRVKNTHVGEMELYALALDGSRMKKIPMKTADGEAEFTLDTTGYPTPYFELAIKK